MSKPVILYDGKCNFCNAVVNFVIDKDRNKIFLFSPLQSREARQLLRERDEAFASLKTVYVIDGPKTFKRSAAIFHILGKLGFPYSIFSAFRILPLFITDSLYKFVARNRYKWFGMSDQVIEPAGELRDRFLGSKP